MGFVKATPIFAAVLDDPSLLPPRPPERHVLVTAKVVIARGAIAHGKTLDAERRVWGARAAV